MVRQPLSVTSGHLRDISLVLFGELILTLKIKLKRTNRIFCGGAYGQATYTLLHSDDFFMLASIYSVSPPPIPPFPFPLFNFLLVLRTLNKTLVLLFEQHNSQHYCISQREQSDASTFQERLSSSFCLEIRIKRHKLIL